MRVMVCVVALALAAGADPDAGVAALAERLGSADPEVRARAAPELGAMADAEPERLAPLLDHPDAEVAGAVRGALEARGIFRDPVKTKRCRELLVLLGRPEPDMTARKGLLGELLDLGAPAVRLVQRELEAAPEGVALAAPETVIEAGTSTRVALRARNGSRFGFWWLPSSRSLSMHEEPFGIRPVMGGGCGGGRYGRRFVCGGHDPRTPQQKVVDSLALLRRVPPGEAFDVAAGDLVPARCGLIHASCMATGIQRDVQEAEFGGATLSIPERDIDASPAATFAALRETPLAGYAGSIVRDGRGRWALEIEAQAEHAAPQPAGFYDVVWWVAEGEGGRLLGHGSLRDEAAGDAAWAKGDRRVFPFEHDLPEGTRRLWMGFDESPYGPQLVPAPVEIR